MPSSFSFRRKSLFSRRKGGRKRILKDKKPIKKPILKEKKPIKKPILKRIEERKEKERELRKPKERKVTKGKAPPSFAVAVVLAVNTNGYYYIYHIVYKINVWASFLQKIKNMRQRPSTVDMWVFTTADLVEGRLNKMISDFEDELRDYRNTIGPIYKLDGRELTDFDVTVFGHIVLGELQTKVRKYGAYIQQRSLDEWGNEDENQSY